jgi:uncharacterized membrane protein HdeD (DUF308 family)
VALVVAFLARTIVEVVVAFAVRNGEGVRWTFVAAPRLPGRHALAVALVVAFLARTIVEVVVAFAVGLL